jgi:hypothetical protein
MASLRSVLVPNGSRWIWTPSAVAKDVRTARLARWCFDTAQGALRLHISSCPSSAPAALFNRYSPLRGPTTVAARRPQPQGMALSHTFV